MAFDYCYTLERQDNGWWLVRFPGIPEALTEGETQEEARGNAINCVIAALEGYMKVGKPLPRQGAAGGKLICRGWPKSAAPKEAVSLRLDPDVLEHFRATGPGWQSRINAALRKLAKLGS